MTYIPNKNIIHPTDFSKHLYEQSINARNISWTPSPWKYIYLKNITTCQGVTNQVKVTKATFKGGKAPPKRRYNMNRIQCMKIRNRKPNCKSVLPTKINLQNPDYKVIDNFCHPKYSYSTASTLGHSIMCY